MTILVPGPVENSKWAFMDVYCPRCFPHRDCGMVDGGAVGDGDRVEFHHSECGHTWEVLISIPNHSERTLNT